MCGIIGYVGKKNAIEVLINGLKALEYRGYDSVGIAYKTCNRIEIIKSVKRIKDLENKLPLKLHSNIGIGHTRWATHGKPNEVNCHPHKSGKFIIVHNGIIENYETLKKILMQSKYKFKSETDSEVIAALLDKLYKEKNDIKAVLIELRKLLIGSYALGIICDDEPDNLYAIRKDSPLIVGISDNGYFIASDVPAILKYTNEYILIDDEIILLNDSLHIYNNKLEEINKDIINFEGNIESAEKGGFEHFMLKEINEEPTTIKNIINKILNQGVVSLDENMTDFNAYNNITLIGCGSAYHAALIGQYLIEKYVNIKTDVYIASEFRYQKTFLDNNSLVIFISQSGETADTLACLRKVTEMDIDTLAIVNVIGSSIAREAKNTIYTHAGPEISVATTKAYIAQVAILSLLALNNGYKNNNISEKKLFEIIESFYKLPDILSSLIKEYKEISKELYQKDACFFIGRGIDYMIGVEGSLKLKEISYINSSAFPAGELKHGTISLIEEGTNVIAILTDKHIADKTISNIKEVKSRGAKITLIATDNIRNDLSFADNKIIVPFINDFINPIVTIIPLQLISYEVAKLRGCDIDKPKNLAKSVTVE